MLQSMAVTHEQLDALDEALVSVRRHTQRPGYRRRLLAALGEPVDLGTLRAVRAVGRLADDVPSVGDVAELLMIDASTASRLLDRAVCAGYVARTPAPHDRRRSQLALTEAGVALLDKADAARRRVLSAVTEHWDPDDLDALSTLLARLGRDLDRLETP
jgi:DNA-binding MarR family transcriptional regulator